MRHLTMFTFPEKAIFFKETHFTGTDVGQDGWIEVKQSADFSYIAIIILQMMINSLTKMYLMQF